jgi:hypothetical protein
LENGVWEILLQKKAEKQFEEQIWRDRKKFGKINLGKGKRVHFL